MEMEMDEGWMIVRPEKGGFRDLLRYAVTGDIHSFSRFLDFDNGDQTSSSSTPTPTPTPTPNADHRWIILLSILVRKIILFFAKPMEWTGRFLDFLLNLLSLNGNFFGLLRNFIHGNVVVPVRDTETFTSTIGQLDGRVDLHEFGGGGGGGGREGLVFKPEIGNRALMDLCIMSSKLAYENPQFIKSVVNRHWKMHFVDFYDCWNDFQKQRSTQLFILLDKPKHANFILVSFRGTELFDAHDWSTDFDYSWYHIPQVGKIHMGFLEALGLGTRDQPATFSLQLQHKTRKLSSTNGVSDETKTQRLSAYSIVRSKLRSLLEEHKDANFIVTGHSLGGALAILFPTVLVVNEEMDIMERLLGVYTFGQPRIGNRQLARFMEPHLERPLPKYFRLVYCNDIVPRLPYDDNTFFYKHFGACLYYNTFYNEKKVEEEPNRNFSGIRFVFSEHLIAVWELIRGLTMGYVEGPEYKEGWFRTLARIVGLALPGISAHCPTDYVNSVRLGKGSPVQMSSSLMALSMSGV